MTAVEPVYVAVALAAAVAVTVALRALPFAIKGRVKDSDLVARVSTWMPLGAVVILAVYYLARIDVAGPQHGVPELAGIAVTVAAHLRWHNLMVSLVGGTAVCLALTNLT